MKRSEKRIIHLIVWEDPSSDSKWHGKEELDNYINVSGGLHCYSVGEIIRQSKDSILIASRLSGEKDYCGLTQRIPRGTIKNIRRIGVLEIR